MIEAGKLKAELVLPDHTVEKWDARFSAHIQSHDTAAVMVVEPVFVPWTEKLDKGSRLRRTMVAGKYGLDNPVAHLLCPSDVIIVGSDPVTSSVENPANVGWQIVYRGIYNNSAGWWFLVASPDLSQAVMSGEWSNDECIVGMNACVALDVQRCLDARNLGWDLWQFGDAASDGVIVHDRLVTVASETDDNGCARAVVWTMESGATHRVSTDAEIVDSPHGGSAWSAPVNEWLGSPMVSFGDELPIKFVSGKSVYVRLESAGDSLVGVDESGQSTKLDLGTVLKVALVESEETPTTPPA